MATDMLNHMVEENRHEEDASVAAGHPAVRLERTGPARGAGIIDTGAILAA
jgi:hypothetical protein